MINHMLSHKGKARHVCEKCGKKFTYKSEYTNHIRKENNDPLVCIKCNHKFFSRSNFGRHVQVCGVDKAKRRKFKCRFCDKLFAAERYRDEHINILHTQRDLLMCPLCGKQYLHQASLLRHTAKNHQENKTEQYGYSNKDGTPCARDHGYGIYFFAMIKGSTFQLLRQTQFYIYIH